MDEAEVSYPLGVFHLSCSNENLFSASESFYCRGPFLERCI